MARPNGVPVSFQSTLPRRSDIAGKIDAWQIQSFNPRSREGATLTPIRSGKAVLSFNPRSREGATVLRTTFAAASLFQSTLPRRSDDFAFSNSASIICFNPRSREGATIYNAYSIFSSWFQSTLPRRSDAIYHKFSFSNIQYSLTFCTNRTFQNLQISFDKCPFNTFCYFFRCESPDIFMYTVDSHRTRTT